MSAKRSRMTRPFILLVVTALLLGSGPAAFARQDATPRAETANSPRELIGQELEAGRIDYPTSLLYRAYALYEPSALPESLLGNREGTEDRALLAEVKLGWDQLPSSIQDRLTPYVVRPNDSRSIFYDPDRTESIVTEGLADATPYFAKGDCQDNWSSKESDQFPFKVWIHCTGDYRDQIDEAIAIVEDFWEREVALMGPPILDAGTEAQGGDSDIDMYFVEDTADPVPRIHEYTYLAEGAAAQAAVEEPIVGTTSSGFIIASRPLLGTPALTIVMAHEFFHVLQQAHNWQVSFGFKGTPYSDDFDMLEYSEYWFTEATATWVMTYLYRDTLDPEVIANTVHGLYFKYFLDVDVPLYHSPRQWSPTFKHIYGAFLYFLFLEEEVGAQPIADYWTALENVELDDFGATTALLDEILPFGEHFRDFTVRNLNLDLEPGSPIQPLYRDLDPTFPIDQSPTFNQPSGAAKRIALGDASYADKIPSLSAHYFNFDPANGVNQVTLDFSRLSHADGLDVDVIMRDRDGTWERLQFDATSPVSLCTEGESNGLFYVVLTNHDMIEANAAKGTMTIAGSDTPCA